MSKSIDHPSYPFQENPGPCKHGVSFEGAMCESCYVEKTIEKVQDSREIISDYLNSDDEGLFELSDNLSDIYGFMLTAQGTIEEIKRLRDRLEFSPYGDDKIDELETCIDFLRHEIEQWKLATGLEKSGDPDQVTPKDLEQELEALKCCGNCKYQDFDHTKEVNDCFICTNTIRLTDKTINSVSPVFKCEYWENYKNASCF